MVTATWNRGGGRVLVVHRAERATALADALTDLLAVPLDDPFAAEVVAVPAKGVERWLAQRLSHRLGASSGSRTAVRTDGVCANVTFPSPREMLDAAVKAAAPDAAQRLVSWVPERLVWAVLEVLDAAIEEDWCRVPRRHLFVGGEVGAGATGRRLSLASHVAHLFDTYARSRPEMLRRWAGGDLSLADGTRLEEHEQWQPRLWQRLLDRLGGLSPVDLHGRVCGAIRAYPDRLPTPQRVSLFGASRLPNLDLEILSAIAEHRDVHLWLHHASPTLWDTVAVAPPVRRRADDATPLTNPLLRSLSRDVRELQYVLRARLPGAGTVHHPPRNPESHPNRLLARLKADLAADRVPAEPGTLDPDDRSLQVHACHGRTRQVEVLREVIVGLLADDPTLEPRDVIVMCPDVEAFAPLLAAAFTTRAEDASTRTSSAHPADRLRVRVADRALHQSNPVIAVLDRLLDLGSSRWTAGDVLDLAEHPAVARRFGFDDEAIERLRDWVSAAGVRWGLDQAHRAEWGLEEVRDGTWRLGADRLLLGVAVDIDMGLVGDVLPLDDVDSADIDLVGRVAELIDRVTAFQADVAEPRTARQWAETLEAAALSLAAPALGDEWQEVHLRDVLDDALVEHAPADGALVGLAELRPVLREALAGQPTRTGFRTGALTVCTLVPMRSVPHRVVVLLGLDDGAFPRQSVRDGDDLLARDPWVGDRDPRSEDRQLLLDAMCAAGEHLVITYTGHDERTGVPVPPAVPLGELLDAVDRAAVGPRGERGRDAVTTNHPLQPFDARAFTPNALGTARPFSFDPLAYSGAVASQAAHPDPPRPLLHEPLPRLALTDVELDDVVALLTSPAKAFLRQRLLLSLTERDEEPHEALPLDLDPLEQWHVGDRLLRDRLAGVNPQAARRLERARGALPPGPIGNRALDEIAARVEALAVAAAPLLTEEPDSYDVSVDLGDGTRLTGTVSGVRGGHLVRVEYSRLGPKHRLAAWVRLLALTAAHPDTAWQAQTIGRGPGPKAPPCASSTLGPVPPRTAHLLLKQYVALDRDGLRAPLPVPCKTAGAYAFLRWDARRISSARAEAERAWTDSTKVPGEQSEVCHVLLLGRAAPFEALLAEHAAPTDYYNGWPADEEDDRFGVLARRLWDPLLRHETRAAQ